MKLCGLYLASVGVSMFHNITCGDKMRLAENGMQAKAPDEAADFLKYESLRLLKMYNLPRMCSQKDGRPVLRIGR